MKIDFTKLLGFDTVSDRIAEELDFQDEALGDNLGAKVGIEPPSDLRRDTDDQSARPE